MPPLQQPVRLAPITALAVTLTLSACSTGGGSADSGSQDGGDNRETTDAGGVGGDQLTVVASFYPLEYVVERVAGDHVDVVTLTSPGIDPHDLELTPRDVATVKEADLLVYSSGLQSAVDDAVSSQAADHALDVNEAAGLVGTGEAGHDDDAEHDEEQHADDDEPTDDEGHDDEGHTDDDADAEDDDGHDHGGEDPHFWLDPERYSAVTGAVADQLATLDPANATTYQANADTLVADLTALDEQFATGLAECQRREVVTTHEAFGYLTDRYGLEQIAITGLSPESEPTPARLADITGLVREHDVTTIYSEVLLGSAIADTIAAETGADVLVLDPVEGITEASAGSDYVEVMQANLEALRTGLGCE